MSKYKMICIDVDGTLYNDDKIIPLENIKAIQEAASKGIQTVITTGRMLNYGYLYGEMLGVDTLTIAANGAYVKYGEEVVLHENLPLEDALLIMRKLEKYNLFSHYYGKNLLLCKGDLGDGNGYVYANTQLPEDKKFEIVVTDNLEKELYKRENDILKALIFSKGDLELLKKVREEFKDLPQFEVVSSSKYNIEILKSGVSKARGIEMLINRLGIAKEEVIAIGDEENDLPMIRYVGMGVAMGNATMAVKKAAKMITETNNDAGVAKAIRALCLDS